MQCRNPFSLLVYNTNSLVRCCTCTVRCTITRLFERSKWQNADRACTLYTLDYNTKLILNLIILSSRFLFSKNGLEWFDQIRRNPRFLVFIHGRVG